MFTIPVLRYMKTYGLTHEQLAMVSVVQREWAAKNPRVIPGAAGPGELCLPSYLTSFLICRRRAVAIPDRRRPHRRAGSL